MAQAGTLAESQTSAPREQQKRQRQKRSARRALWIGAVVSACICAYAVIIALHWPFEKQKIIDALQERSARTVTIGRFTRTYFPPGCIAEDIRFLHRKHKEKAPLITVRKLVMVTSYSKVATLQERLSLVRVTDMHVTVPPSEPGEANPVMPLTFSQSAPEIKIDRIIADGATLDFMRKSGKKPYRLVVEKLRLDGVGNNLPMAYKTVIGIELPPGKIRSEGTFGTWNPKNPGSTPVKGSYTFEDANLAAFGGISGTLSSSGSFDGMLRQIGVEGDATVPNFKVYDTSHERELAVAYQAMVDGTNGDTRLDRVTARFDHTIASFKGAIAKSGNADGKTASIDMWTNSARVEDVLDLFISAQRAPMSGRFSFSGHVDIPSGPAPFVRRLKMTGDFGIAAGEFANSVTESNLTRLSNSSKKRVEEEQPRASAVLSDLKGHGTAVDGIATLSNVSFAIPHAKARMHGTYNLLNYRVDLHGTLLTSGDPSQATRGFRSLMMKVITPFLKRKHTAKVVPFKITGSYQKVDTSLDMGRGEQPSRR